MTALKWFGTGTAIAGAALLAANVAASGWGFALFLASSLAWSAVAWRTRDAALGTMQAAFTAVNVLGIWRWLF